MKQRDREHATFIARLRAQADYDSYEEFYADDQGREGDDVYIGEVVGGELRWEIRCLPNGEVAGVATAWTDEQAHQAHRGVHFDGWGRPYLRPAFIPVLIVVLGRAASADDAQARIASAASLDTIRAALA